MSIIAAMVFFSLCIVLEALLMEAIILHTCPNYKPPNAEFLLIFAQQVYRGIHQSIRLRHDEGILIL